MYISSLVLVHKWFSNIDINLQLNTSPKSVILLHMELNIKQTVKLANDDSYLR